MMPLARGDEDGNRAPCAADHPRDHRILRLDWLQHWPEGSPPLRATVAVAASSIALGIGGGSPPAPLTRCSDPFVYDRTIDEIIPAEMIAGLESAVPPVQPGDKFQHHLRPWTVFCSSATN